MTAPASKLWLAGQSGTGTSPPGEELSNLCAAYAALDEGDPGPIVDLLDPQVHLRGPEHGHLWGNLIAPGTGPQRCGRYSRDAHRVPPHGQADVRSGEQPRSVAASSPSAESWCHPAATPDTEPWPARRLSRGGDIPRWKDRAPGRLSVTRDCTRCRGRRLLTPSRLTEDTNSHIQEEPMTQHVSFHAEKRARLAPRFSRCPRRRTWSCSRSPLRGSVTTSPP